MIPLWTLGYEDGQGRTQLAPISREGFHVRMMPVLESEEDADDLIREAELDGLFPLVMRTAGHAKMAIEFHKSTGVKYVARDFHARRGPFKPVPIDDFLAELGGD